MTGDANGCAVVVVDDRPGSEGALRILVDAEPRDDNQRRVVAVALCSGESGQEGEREDESGGEDEQALGHRRRVVELRALGNRSFE